LEIGHYKISDIQDLRAGYTMIEVEQGDDFGIWTNGGTSTLQIPIDAEAGKKFYRFKMTE
tara:strand:- start:1925 stop:2104 length:180 start_codon:yes stop_codon:yes gene_type:complete